MACFDTMKPLHQFTPSRSIRSELNFSNSAVNCSSSGNGYTSGEEVMQFWLHVDNTVGRLLNRFKSLAVQVADYLYKPPKEDCPISPADVSSYLQDLDHYIIEQQGLGQLDAAIYAVRDDVPQLLRKRWICLAAELRTFQHNVDLWINDQHIIDRLNAAIEVVINADFAIMCNKHDLSVYHCFHEINKQANVLMHFFRADQSVEAKLPFSGYDQITGILYIES